MNSLKPASLCPPQIQVRWSQCFAPRTPAVTRTAQTIGLLPHIKMRSKYHYGKTTRPRHAKQATNHTSHAESVEMAPHPVEGLPAALTFLRTFPDAASFHILILSSDKKALVSRPQASPRGCSWARFTPSSVRPKLGNLVLVDADKYQRTLETHNPSASRRLPLKTTKFGSLCAHNSRSKAGHQGALGADAAFAKTTQVGRLPASVNIKPGIGNRVHVLHSSWQDLTEEAFLALQPNPSFSFNAGPPPRQAPPASATVERSKQDWSMACFFFEERPEATVPDAIAHLRGSFRAVRPNQA